MEPFSQKVAQLRREYGSQPLEEREVAADPFAQFHAWFDQAVNAEQPDPEAMTLSTAQPDGGIAARIVLLKDCDARGFVFFTNYESSKAQHLAGTARAALTFYWFALHRQVRIEGPVEKVSREESEAYFRTRPRGSQLGAWASPQSQPIPNREALEARLAEVEGRYAGQDVPCPPHWGGYRVVPGRIEFWQGRESRLHDRILYTREDRGWRIERLAP